MAVKKLWYDIVAPKEFGGRVISQTLSADPKHLKGRILQISYADISRDFKKFFIKLHLCITSVEDKECHTELVAHSMQNDHIYRMVRRRTRKVSLIQEVTTKDNKKVRVKTVMILPRRVNTSMKARIRAKARELIEKKSATVNFIDLVKILILGSFVMDVKTQCSKIYPVSQIEFYKSKLLSATDKTSKAKINKVREDVKKTETKSRAKVSVDKSKTKISPKKKSK